MITIYDDYVSLQDVHSVTFRYDGRSAMTDYRPRRIYFPRLEVESTGLGGRGLRVDIPLVCEQEPLVKLSHFGFEPTRRHPDFEIPRSQVVGIASVIDTSDTTIRLSRQGPRDFDIVLPGFRALPLEWKAL